MKNLNTLIASASFILLTGCANPADMGMGVLNNAITGAVSGASSGMMNSLQSSLLQNMAGSVINGQIGSQLQTADQVFRLQQLNNTVQSGLLNQTQQWVNPQTGSAMKLTPVAQQSYNPQAQKQCQTMQEVMTLPNGQSITENRTACLNAQTGQWSFVQ